MKNILSVLILFIITTTIHAQIDSTEVSFVSYWSIGDSYDFKISKIVESWEEGKLTKNSENTYIANFTVIDSTETSYTIKWIRENNLKDNFNVPIDLLGKFSKFASLEVNYTTSEVGDIIEVLNWKEISDVMNELFDEITVILGEEGNQEQKERLKTSLQPLRDAYSSKDGVETNVLKELQYFHYPMGLVYNISEPIYYDDELLNLLGGKPIKAKGKISFENVDHDNGFCVMVEELKIDEKDTKQILKEVFKKMGFKDKKLKKALKEAVFNIEEKNVYEYYFNPGVPHKIEAKREVDFNINNDKGRRVEITRIELLYEDDETSETEVFEEENTADTAQIKAKLIGEWEGKDGTEFAKMRFDTDGYAFFQAKGMMVGGKEFEFQGQKGKMVYQVLTRNDTTLLDLIITKLETGEQKKLLAIIRFIDDDTMEFALDAKGTRPTSFHIDHTMTFKRKK